MLTVGAATGALAKTIGKAKAEITMPVVMKLQKSFKHDEFSRLSLFLLEIRVGKGAKT